MLFSVGSVYAIVTTPDDVPGQDIVIPIVCEDTHLIDYTLLPASVWLANSGVADGTFNTVWAIAEVVPNSPTTANVYVYNVKSEFVKDTSAQWTAMDVINNDCQSLIASMSGAQREKMAALVTINGEARIIYAGYVIYVNQGYNPAAPFVPIAPFDQLVSWVYQVDMPNGFAAGYNGYDVEGGIDTPLGFPFIPSDLDEAAGASIVSASQLYPRYFFLNANATPYNVNTTTFNWWYILKGGPVNPLHNLNGVICNEEEECVSLTIFVPNNFNIIDVGSYIPSSIFHTTVIQEHNTLADMSNSVVGISAGETANMGGGFAQFYTNTGILPNFLNPTTSAIVSTLGWSYQRAATGAAISNWDVIHPMHATRP